jgi:hypothetical protein
MSYIFVVLPSTGIGSYITYNTGRSSLMSSEGPLRPWSHDSSVYNYVISAYITTNVVSSNPA